MKIFGKKLTVLLAATALVAATVRAEDVEEETKTLDELYEDAIAEGGNLVYYAGGDLQSQQTAVHDAFVAAYPEINFTIVVDYSKYHDVRIDNQLDTDTLVPDITALQTVQNFPRWDQEGKLLAYKPAGFSKIYDDFKSENGTWMSHMVGTFSFFYDRERLAAAGLDAPESAEDLIDPQYAGHIASTYPHDDDAALFVYTRYVEKYGWDWVAQLAAQDLQFKRGSNTPGDAVDSGDKLIGVAAPGSFYPSNTSNITFVAGNGTQYLTWGQHIAILKDAKNPAAAKLFLNWILSTEIQTTMLSGMSVRTDIDAPAGYKHLWEYEEGSTDLFPTFMEDRAAVEHWKQTFALYFGEVQGEPSPGWLGLHPGA